MSSSKQIEELISEVGEKKISVHDGGPGGRLGRCLLFDGNGKI